jgi:hypothetical protein
MYRVVVCGSRDFDDYNFAESCLNWILAKKRNEGYEIVVVSGCAKGADKIGERYAYKQGFKVDTHPADWEKYGKRAGYIRNIEMIDSCDGVVAFWNGESKGTKHSIDYANEKNVPCVVVKYKEM